MNRLKVLRPRRKPVSAISLLIVPVSALLGLVSWAQSVPSSEEGIGTSTSPSSDTLTLYLAPEGDNENRGVRRTEPLRTLAEVEKQIRIRLEEEPRNVVVKILPGVFKGESVTWSFTMPDHTISFVGNTAPARRPIFDGQSMADQKKSGRRHIWFQLTAADGRPTNLVFRGLHVRNYEMALLFRGDRSNPEGWNGGNVVEYCLFSSIGDVADPKALSWSPAAVDFINSRYNVIKNSTFDDIINTEEERARLIHAVYLAHYSAGNTIEGNRFRSVSGDPVRVRDFSNHNMIRANQFERSGERAIFSEWYCRRDVAVQCTKPEVECASWVNHVVDNEYDRAFDGSDIKPTIVRISGVGPPGCYRPYPGADRIRPRDNVQASG